MDHGDDGRTGELLRGYRRATGLTQRQLADAARVSIGVVRDLEQGLTARPRAESVRRLAVALDLDQRPAAEFVRAMLGEAGAAPGAGRAGSAVGLRLGVLGPLTACRGGRPVALGAGRQRAVLGLLALYPGTLIRREAIIDVLWADDPPPTVVAMVQCYISRLRRLLDPGRPASARDGLLISTGTCYRLQAGTSELDQLAFGEMTARAQAARAAGELAAACDLYVRALGMWRGEPAAERAGARSPHDRAGGQRAAGRRPARLRRRAAASG
jgi:transcriptional regulator with XRE-family HTH domain